MLETEMTGWIPHSQGDRQSLTAAGDTTFQSQRGQAIYDPASWLDGWSYSSVHLAKLRLCRWVQGFSNNHSTVPSHPQHAQGQPLPHPAFETFAGQSCLWLLQQSSSVYAR